MESLDTPATTVPNARMTDFERLISCSQPCGSHLNTPWFCIWTRPNMERVALQELRQQGYPTFLPLYLRKLPNRSERIDPLFPRYLFAQPSDGLWGSMRGTKGVSDVIRDSHGTPRHVSPFAVNALLAQCAPNLVIYPPKPVPLDIHDRARVTQGPFAELDGICFRTTKDRVWILLQIMGRETEASFPREVLEPA